MRRPVRDAVEYWQAEAEKEARMERNALEKGVTQKIIDAALDLSYQTAFAEFCKEKPVNDPPQNP